MNVECDVCGRSMPYASGWVWMSVLRNRQIVTERVCFICAQAAVLIPGLDARHPPMEPDTTASHAAANEQPRWGWLWINPTLFQSREE